MPDAPPTKRAIAAIILLDKGGADPRFLAVLRPPDDDALPSTWGLPAASLRESESWKGAVPRLGHEELGVAIEPVRPLARGSLERPGYRLDMRLFEARIVRGTPSVPQQDRTVTQYVDWRWSDSQILVEGARRGSLCCRIYLNGLGIDWETIDGDSQ